MNELYWILFGVIGWSLSIYFGFFRFKQYQWTRKKLIFDLFARINQNNSALFIKVIRLIHVKKSQQPVLLGPRYGVLLKYSDKLHEKLFLIRNNVVNRDIARYWIAEISKEIAVLARKDKRVVDELHIMLQSKASLAGGYRVDILFSTLANNEELSQDRIDMYYQELVST